MPTSVQSVNAMTNDTMLSADQLLQLTPARVKGSLKGLAGGKKIKKKRLGDSRDSINDLIEGISVARGIISGDPQTPNQNANEEGKRAIDFYAGSSLEEQKVPRVRLNQKLVDPSPARERPSISLMSINSNVQQVPNTRNTNQLHTI